MEAYTVAGLAERLAVLELQEATRAKFGRLEGRAAILSMLADFLAPSSQRPPAR